MNEAKQNKKKVTINKTHAFITQSLMNESLLFPFFRARQLVNSTTRCATTLAGTSNAPEYYINMRTGTHYFPRGVTGVAAVERNCQKFGLNKIEETASEAAATTTTTTATVTTILSNHRRTESCDLGKSKLKTASALVPTSNDAKTSVIAMRAMSPDVQHRLAYHNYRGFECKCK